MKIKLLCSVSGPGVRFNRGVVYDVPKAQAKEFLEARYAVPVPAAPEKAAPASVETR
jgi:hypothetical protein